MTKMGSIFLSHFQVCFVPEWLEGKFVGLCFGTFGLPVIMKMSIMSEQPKAMSEQHLQRV